MSRIDWTFVLFLAVLSAIVVVTFSYGYAAGKSDMRVAQCPPQNYLQLQDGQRIYFSTQAIHDAWSGKDGGQ